MKSVEVRVNADRVNHRLDQLASIGGDPRGRMSRFAFTPAHAEACGLVAAWTREASLDPFLDRAGNLIGLGPGDGPALAAGSHLDTVPMGGRFDGALRVVGAVECAQALTGELPDERMRTILDRDGRTLAERIAAWDCPLPRRTHPALAAFLAAYLELHIEQGPRLHAEGLDAAAVTAIAGISRTTVVFTGRANHGGTTPMDMRRDALWGASALVLEVRRLALASAGNTVATVGRIEVEPGSTNVIPGIARLRVELRSGEEAHLAGLRGEVEQAAHRLAREYGLEVQFESWDHMSAVPLDGRIQVMVLESARRQGLRAISMPSWAGHDAKNLAPHLLVGMIFVPSKDGISHAPTSLPTPGTWRWRRRSCSTSCSSSISISRTRRTFMKPDAPVTRMVIPTSSGTARH